MYRYTNIIYALNILQFCNYISIKLKGKKKSLNENTARRQPSASPGERPQEKQTLSMP